MSKITKQIYEYEYVEQEAISHLYKNVKDTPKDGEWRNYKGKFISVIGNHTLDVNFRFDGEHLSIADLEIGDVKESILCLQ